MAAITEFGRLPFSEKLLVLRAAIALATVKARLAMIGWAAVRKRISRTAENGPTRDHRCLTLAWPSLVQRPSADRVAWAIEATSARIPGGRNCLVLALASECLLGRYGYPSELKIGVKRGANGEFAAHAWLESGGRVLLGEFELDSYVLLDTPGGKPFKTTR
jgi:hypothetical protein